MKTLCNCSRTIIVLLTGAMLMVGYTANSQIARGQSTRLSPEIVADSLIVSGTPAFVGSPGGFVQGGDFWQKKDYRQWNDAECKKLLENSPWAAIYPIGSVVMEPLKGARNTASANDLNHENTPRIEYHVQFRSALPVRQAVVRQALIKQKYDQLTPDQKKAMDMQTEKYLAGNYSDRIALYVAYGANIADDNSNLATYWQKQTTDLLKNTVYLINERGVRVPLSQYVVNGGGVHEFEFNFPREFNGKPVILPEDKTVKLEFIHPVVPNTNKAEVRVLVEFKPSKMVIGGSLVY